MKPGQPSKRSTTSLQPELIYQSEFRIIHSLDRSAAVEVLAKLLAEKEGEIWQDFQCFEESWVVRWDLTDFLNAQNNNSITLSAIFSTDNSAVIRLENHIKIQEGKNTSVDQEQDLDRIMTAIHKDYALRLNERRLENKPDTQALATAENDCQGWSKKCIKN